MLIPFLIPHAPRSLHRTFKAMLESAHQTLGRYRQQVYTGRASVFISEWLRSVRLARAVLYTVMGRALAISSGEAKKVEIPTNVIAIDLYMQCKILEMGRDVIYNDNAMVFFKPANNIYDLASQVVRAVNGHKQIKDYVSSSGIGLPDR